MSCAGGSSGECEFGGGVSGGGDEVADGAKAAEEEEEEKEEEGEEEAKDCATESALLGFLLRRLPGGLTCRRRVSSGVREADAGCANAAVGRGGDGFA